MWLSGRAVALQAIGRRFESDHLHHKQGKQDYPEHVDKRIQGSDEVKEQVTKEHTGNARGI